MRSHRLLIPLIRCELINVIIEPIRIQSVRVASPLLHWFLFRVVVRVIIHWDLWIQALGEVSVVLLVKGQHVILRMSCDKYVLATVTDYEVRTCHVRLGYNLKVLIVYNVLLGHTGIS